MTFDPFRRLAGGLAAALLAASATGAFAHDSRVGDIVITHAFATPSLPGTTTGAAYFVRIDNGGAAADRLVRASTPVCDHVELHAMAVDGQGVMRMREVDAIELAARTSVAMRPGGAGMHLMLVGLKQPLNEGATFPMTLEFQRAGKVEVKVVVQVPKPHDGAGTHLH